MWVRSEYAGEFAVLSAWLCALSPWSVSYVSRSGLRLFRVHFVYVFLQFFPDADLGEGLDPYVPVQDGAQFPPGLRSTRPIGSGSAQHSSRGWLLSAVPSSASTSTETSGSRRGRRP